MRRICCIIISMVLLATGPIAQAVNRRPVEEVHFEVAGNAKRFAPETWKQKGKVKLADSVVRSVSIKASGRAVDPNYMNQATMQQIFDEILASKIIKKTLGEEIELGWNDASVGIDVNKITLNCYTGYNKKRDHHDNTDLSLLCLDAEKYQVDDVVLVGAQSFTYKEPESGYVYIRSKPLYDLVVAMCAQTYTSEGLKKAQKLDWGFREPDAITEDGRVIGQLVDVLTSGEPVSEPLELDPHVYAEFVFTMPDERSHSIKLVNTGYVEDDDIRFFSYTANGTYEIDFEDLDGIMIGAGLKSIKGKWD